MTFLKAVNSTSSIRDHLNIGLKALWESWGGSRGGSKRAVRNWTDCLAVSAGLRPARFHLIVEANKRKRWLKRDCVFLSSMWTWNTCLLIDRQPHEADQRI